MKKIILLIVLSLIIPSICLSQSQRDINLQDLDFVYSNLEKSTGYQTQDKTKADSKYLSLKKQFTTNDYDTLTCFIKLCELIDQVKNQHDKIEGNPEAARPANYELSSNQAKINIDSLAAKLNKKTKNSYEGIYKYGILKLGIRKRRDGIYEAIVLKSNSNLFQPGQTIYYFINEGNNVFRWIARDENDHRLITYKLRFSNGEFGKLGVQKETLPTYSNNLDYGDKLFFTKDIDANIKYIKLGSFFASNEIFKQASAFYATISNIDSTKNLIVDLRNNPGGGGRTSIQFLRLFKSFTGKIYVLTNYYTVSNAEQFVVRLKQLPNVTVLGGTTNGTITYGHTTGTLLITPSKRFRIHLTDMKDNWKDYLPYEGKGIKPDKYLDEDKNWIDQTVRLINRN